MGQLLGHQKSKGLCTICLEKMSMENFSALHCGHLFHFQCIKHWLIEQQTCPECRQPSKLDEIGTSLSFHDNMDDEESETTDTISDSESSDKSEIVDSYNDLLKKLDVAYLELKNEKSLHKQTKEFLEKVQCENLKLVKIIQVLVEDDEELLEYSNDE
ncbi:unnamed protein product [Onchocerca ochengi]|uniref:RING-type domain-containing protein n=1 Tax=Onchocerca ochengi TaxID=42157 RepID=A0A182EIU7_ONCOC|nr:unnamed protein product [Onchocerca ochengi]